MPRSPYSGSPSQLAVGRSDVVFSDPSAPFEVRPIFRDLLRTRYCIPGSVFLVERIESVAPIRRQYRAIRLLVSDGVSCVQAVLRGEAHGLVDNGTVYAGCYVRVGSFELRFLDTSDGQCDHGEEDENGVTVRPDMKRKQVTETPKTVYLVLENPVTVGWNTAYLNLLGPRNQVPLPVGAEESERNAAPERSVGAVEKDKGPLPDPKEEQTATSDLNASPRYDDIAADPNISELLSGDLSKIDTSRTVSTSAKPLIKPSSNIAQPSNGQLPWSTDDPTKPLRLTPLRMIPNLPYQQNWMVNILAVVSSISDVQPSHLPPYHQRTARLTDPSTSKHVLLTVFLDPDDFTPAVGSVVLILGVKNHRFDGGSLKKYASDRPKSGGRWWFEEPDELGWCDVAGLRAWWDSKRATG